MNEIIASLGMQGWKPFISAWFLPPLCFLLLLLVALVVTLRRRHLGLAMAMLAALGIWISGSSAAATWLEARLLSPPPPLTEQAIAEFRRQVGKGHRMAIVVLGGGRRAHAPETQRAALKWISLERLHFGVWLSRQTGAPLMFSGGVGHGAHDGPTEAEIAATVAERDFQRPLRWIEARSRDTRENAVMTLSVLQGERLDDLVVVTHRTHMPRAMALFRWAAERQGATLRLHAAPMGGGSSVDHGLLRWLPTPEGYTRNWMVWHEAIGLWANA